MNATPVSKELVRLLVIEHGQKRAAELSQVPYETVRKWTQRGQWLRVPNVPFTSPKAIVDRIQDELADNEKETRLSLSRYAKRASKDSESATLREAKLVKAVAETAGITHGWREKRENDQSQVAVNIAILNA